MVGTRAIRAGRAYVELFADDTKLARGLRRAQWKLRNFGRTVKATGMQMIGLGAAMGAPLLAGAKTFADLETQLARVSTMLDNPAEHMDTFRSEIRRMAVEFGESTDAIAGGLYDILSASVAPEKALGVLTEALKAAKAGMTDTKTAADAITTVLNSYGLEAEQAGAVSDWFFSVVRQGKTTFEELAPAIGMVAPTAASAGVSLEELGGMIALLTKNGVRTENAITAVTRTIATFLKPSDEAAAYAKELGFELNTATLQAEGLQRVFQRISDLPPDAIAKLFPNIRALRGVIPAIRNMEDFEAIVERVADRAGATETAYQKMAGTLNHQLAQIKQQAVITLGVVGEALAGSLSDLGDRVSEIMTKVQDWARENGDLIISVGKLALKIAAAGGLLVVVGSLAGAVSNLIGVLNGLRVALHALMLHPVIATVTALGVATVGLAYAMDRAQRYTAGLSDKMRETLDAMDRQRAADLDRVRRLRQLAEKESLTADQMERARGLIDDLEGRYGNLGLAVNDATGSITGMAEAQERLNQAMRDAALTEVETRIHELRNNLEELKRESEATAGAKESIFHALFGVGPGMGPEEQEAAMTRVGEQMELTNKQLEAALARWRALKAGEPGALTGGAEGEGAGAGGLEFEPPPGGYDFGFNRADRRYEETLRREKRLAQEIKEVRIRATKEGEAEQLALARARMQEELEAAKEYGLEGMVREKWEWRLQELSEGAAADKAQYSAQGTFSAATAARGMGAGTAAERTAKASEETAKNTGKLADRALSGGLTFT